MENFITGSSSSSSRPIHVYLSLKGDDETCRFIDMLWAALETDDLNTFWDDKKLEPSSELEVSHETSGQVELWLACTIQSMSTSY
ncbi:hypothetical protein QN277_001878 [Acacia crassicarpa]|uniref:Uncharacterized protein n=1 Tax=Acacia crassicarpa TaxID=499986 RepID=A0AAE1TIV8_9FABA|nr:hypothetical protein QN277_001878 [Acacia crassicarpa]